LKAASEAQIRAAGAEPGFGSPVGLSVRPRLHDPGIWVIGDLSLPAGLNYVAGANQPDVHLVGVNYPRDFAVTTLADLAQANVGDPCPECRAGFEARRGYWLAHWQALADFEYADETGHPRPGSAGVGTALLAPILAAILAAQSPGQPTNWPAGLSPVDVYVIVLAAWEGLESWTRGLERRNVKVLVDDRTVSAGVKFSDADLVGAPVRVTVSGRSLEAGGLEVARRGEKAKVLSPDEVAALL
jgi:prolyl-tRNA synthetase